MFDHYSLASLPITVGFDDVQLSSATGFYATYRESVLFFTNWHVVSGRHFNLGDPLSKTAAIPNWVRIGLRDADNPIKLQWVQYPLVDENNQPTWYEHPHKKCDVVALPIGRPATTFTYTINTDLANQDILIEPASTVSIIGYPLGISVAGSLPVWKTGHIASEPMVDVENYSGFLIDAATRTGMSGSPVIWKVRGHYRSKDGKLMMPTTPGNVFLGIYSGRLAEDDALGIVWRPDVIDEIARDCLAKLIK